MRDTIKAKVGYRVRLYKGVEVEGYDNPCLLRDGDNLVMLAQLRSYNEFEEEVLDGGNEAARLYEKFTTVKGNQYLYWRDDEADEDYLTKIEEGK